MGISITGGIKVPQGLFSVGPVPVAPAAGNELWAWGYNTAFGVGVLGLGDVIDRSSPVQVGSLTTWSKVSSGGLHTLAVKTDGTLWGWGRNSKGYLGLGDTTVRSSPVQVGSLTDWDSVSAGQDHTLAVKTDGTLWAWGNNQNRKLGIGIGDDKSSPVQVQTDTDWASCCAASAALGAFSLAIKTNGTIWGWGRNNFGQLGTGNVQQESSPVQIGSSTDWASINAGASDSFATKTDGSLWAIGGFNAFGDLGQGDTIQRSSPVQIGGLTDWASVSGGSNAALAVKTDGTLWAWGGNGQGYLGDGTTVKRSSPVQIGSLTDWSEVEFRTNHTLALKTNGTLWSWGYNNFGKLGSGTSGPGARRSSPVQIGSLTTWTDLGPGTNQSFALKTS